MTSLGTIVTNHEFLRGTQNNRFPCVIKEPYERQAIYTIVVGFNYNGLNLCLWYFIRLHMIYEIIS
jgi:hypothetical protein